MVELIWRFIGGEDAIGEQETKQLDSCEMEREVATNILHKLAGNPPEHIGIASVRVEITIKGTFLRAIPFTPFPPKGDDYVGKIDR